MLLPTILLIAFAVPCASAFNGKFSLAAPPTQCGNFTAVWSGGTPPYELLLVPVGHVTPEIRTIVDNTIDSGTSSSFTLKFPTGSQFVAVLSDATGVGSGGTSDILTVGDGPSDCLTGPVEPKFFLYMDTSTANQCASVPVAWDASASAPVSLWGIIPAGDTFSLNPPGSGTSFNWQANVASGTKMMVVAGDSRGRGTGGSTDIWTVGGGDGSCISGNHPSTTSGPPAGQVLAVNPTSSAGSGGASATSSSGASNPSSGSNGSASGTAGASGSGSNPADPTSTDGSGGNNDGNNGTIATGDPSSSGGPSGGRIAAIAVGTIGGLLLILFILFFVWRARRRRNDNRSQGSSFTDFRDMRAHGDLLASRPPSFISGGTGVSVANRPPHENVPRQYATEPFIYNRLARSNSGYSADVSDASTHDGRGLLAASPIMTPTEESTLTEKSPFAPVTSRTHTQHEFLEVPPPTHSPAPPSFQTMATGGHTTPSRTRSQRQRAVQRGSPFLHPEGEISTGSVDAPPLYDSWKLHGPLIAVNATPREEKSNPFA